MRPDMSVIWACFFVNQEAVHNFAKPRRWLAYLPQSTYGSIYGDTQTPRQTVPVQALRSTRLSRRLRLDVPKFPLISTDFVRADTAMNLPCTARAATAA